MPYFTFIGTSALPYSVVITGVVLLTMFACALDVLGKDGSAIRRGPQWVWLLVVVALPVIGWLIWAAFARPRRRRRRPTQSQQVISAFPEYDRKGRFVPQDPVADAAFLQQCRARAEAQRHEAELQRRRREARD